MKGDVEGRFVESWLEGRWKRDKLFFVKYFVQVFGFVFIYFNINKYLKVVSNVIKSIS